MPPTQTRSWRMDPDEGVAMRGSLGGVWCFLSFIGTTSSCFVMTNVYQSLSKFVKQLKIEKKIEKRVNSRNKGELFN